MSLLDRLESRYGRFAIPGLIRYVVALNALVYVLGKLNPDFLLTLVLWPSKILQGEVWRLVTYIFIPQFGGFLPDWLNAAMYILFLWWVGNGLEQALGSFRLNLYYFTGMAGITVAAFFFGGGFGAALLNTSLLFAFAQFYPDEMIFVLYIIPAKVKWLAWIAAALLGYKFLVNGDWSYRISLIVALANYFVFFGPEVYRNARTRQQVAERRRKFEAANAPSPNETLHQCAVCHRTEVTNPELDFRVARDGQEYCREHLPKPPPAVAAS
jgi:membrane associated rhomboid family serine protease